MVPHTGARLLTRTRSFLEFLAPTNLRVVNQSKPLDRSWPYP